MDSCTTTRSNASVLVEPHQEDSFKQRLTKLNRKAETFGLEPIEVQERRLETYVRLHKYVGRDEERLETTLVPLHSLSEAERSRARPHQLIRYSLLFPIVRLGEWRVLGKVEAADGGNLIFAACQDAAAIQALQVTVAQPIRCDHCKTRRARRLAYLLRSQDGSLQLVGSSCLEDFTGVDPSAALFLADMHSIVKVCDDWREEATASRSNAVWTLHYLADVVFVVKRVGFVSSTRARATNVVATHMEALDLDDQVQRSASLAQQYWADRESDREHAQRIIDWVATLDPAASTFVSNVKTLLASPTVRRDPSHLAFTAASYAAYAKHQAELAERLKPSHHVGTVGEKRTAELVVERVVPLPNPYGREAKHLVLLRDDDGSAIAWRSTAVPVEILRGDGKRMIATFTVNRHSEYRRVPQTDVSRLRVERWLTQLA